MILLLLLALLVLPVTSQATIYYISPSGSNSNNGLTTGAPFLTFSYAINASRASCGDTLVLLDGTYGDGTSTGKININPLVCTAGDEFTITAQNQRQAKIVDNGLGVAVYIQNSAYIIIDGLYARSTDNASATSSGNGTPFRTVASNNIVLRNNVARNVNRNINSHMYTVLRSQNVLLEDNEAYVFHRHCVSGGESSQVVVRRQYCTPRGGRIAGGYNASAGLGGADTLMTMYPCRDCILENSIADGTTGPMALNEMNANYASGVLMSGSKVLGSICYKCDYANGIVMNPRNNVGMNYTPQNNTIRDVAFIDYNSPSAAIRCTDCTNAVVDHVTVLGSGGGTGILADQNTSLGGTPATNSITITNSVVTGIAGNGFIVSSGTYNTWSGDELYSYSNGTAFNPSVPSNWTNTSTSDPQFGTCKVWVPAGAAAKGAGTGGSDIGATILYRYVGGVLTTIPLWDPVTGEFPHGADDADGTNDVTGQSLKDIHTRLNINTGGCSFPSGYGGSPPTDPGVNVSSTDLTGAHIHVIDAGMDSLTVGVMVRWDGYLSTETANPTGVTSSCGSESIPTLTSVWSTTAGDRKMRVFGKIAPTSGTCTLTPTFDSANVSGWVMVSVEKDGVSGYGDTGAAGGLSSTPTVTVSTADDETIIDFLATSNVPLISAGLNQILTTDQLHSTKSLRGASSEQAGVNGGVMSYTMTGSYAWILQGVSLIPTSPGGGSSSTFRLSKYRIYGLHGANGTPESSLGALAAQDTAAEIGTTGSFRIRAELIVETASSTPTGIALFCRKNAGAYAQAMDTFGSNVFKLYGAGVEPTIPATLTATTQRFSGTFQAGYTVRDQSLPVVLPAIPTNTRTEMDYQLTLGNGIVAGDTVNCEIRRDSGDTLGTHTVTPTITAVNGSASMGF